MRTLTPRLGDLPMVPASDGAWGTMASVSFEVSAAAYGQFMGRFSRPLAQQFVGFVGVELSRCPSRPRPSTSSWHSWSCTS